MIIEKPAVNSAKYYTPEKPCKRCGTRQRYKSTGDCVRCVQIRNKNTPNRESHRKKCEARLTRMGFKLHGLTRYERDTLIANNFPGMRQYLADRFGYVELNAHHATFDTTEVV